MEDDDGTKLAVASAKTKQVNYKMSVGKSYCLLLLVLILFFYSAFAETLLKRKKK
jgi:hypothetical protein